MCVGKAKRNETPCNFSLFLRGKLFWGIRVEEIFQTSRTRKRIQGRESSSPFLIIHFYVGLSPSSTPRQTNKTAQSPSFSPTLDKTVSVLRKVDRAAAFPIFSFSSIAATCRRNSKILSEEEKNIVVYMGKRTEGGQQWLLLQMRRGKEARGRKAMKSRKESSSRVSSD